MSLNDPKRRQLGIAAEVLALADHLGITITTLNLHEDDIGVHLDVSADAPRLAAAIDGDPAVKPYSGFATWTAVHRGTPVVVYGPADDHAARTEAAR